MSEQNFIETEIRDSVGFITLNRPQALNALSLPMIRELTRVLQAWRENESIARVMVRGVNKHGPFGAFCAGGDIRYFHEAVMAGGELRDSLEAFFTEEYALNLLIHTYPKPYVVVLDGVVMGGGMGISGHGGANSLRIVTERTKMAMPETAIGLFPDVGGGYFLSRCANSCVGVGEYLALTGQMLSGAEALSMGLADVLVESKDLPALWQNPHKLNLPKPAIAPIAHLDLMQKHFSLGSIQAIVQSLQLDGSEWAAKTLAQLQKNSPLMLAVTLTQIRKARAMSLSDDLRMERGMMVECFAGTPQRHSDAVEGIRALVIDKDQSPRWQPARIEDVTTAMVDAFFG